MHRENDVSRLPCRPSRCGLLDFLVRPTEKVRSTWEEFAHRARLIARADASYERAHVVDLMGYGTTEAVNGCSYCGGVEVQSCLTPIS
jgi:hypothetical protein